MRTRTILAATAVLAQWPGSGDCVFVSLAEAVSRPGAIASLPFRKLGLSDTFLAKTYGAPNKNKITSKGIDQRIAVAGEEQLHMVLLDMRLTAAARERDWFRAPSEVVGRHSPSKIGALPPRSLCWKPSNDGRVAPRRCSTTPGSPSRSLRYQTCFLVWVHVNQFKGSCCRVFGGCFEKLGQAVTGHDFAPSSNQEAAGSGRMIGQKPNLCRHRPISPTSSSVARHSELILSNSWPPGDRNWWLSK